MQNVATSPENVPGIKMRRKYHGGRVMKDVRSRGEGQCMLQVISDRTALMFISSFKMAALYASVHQLGKIAESLCSM